MEKKELLKYLVILIVIMFCIQMFSFYRQTLEKSAKELEETKEEFSTGFAEAYGKINYYSKEVFIKFGEDEGVAENVKNIAQELITRGKIEYINTIHDGIILILPVGSDVTEIRGYFLEEDISVNSQARIIFEDPINFTLTNGSAKLIPLQPITYSLDPINPVGEEIKFDITSVITEAGIADDINLSLLPIELIDVISNIYLKNAECKNNFNVEGSVSWERRKINLSSFIEIKNIIMSNKEDIKYEEKNFILVRPILNSSEIEKIENMNLSYILSASPDRVYVNTTEKEKTIQDFNSIFPDKNISFEFPESELLINFSLKDNLTDDEIKNIQNILSDEIDNENFKRECLLSFKNNITSDGDKILYLNKRKSDIKYYYGINNLNETINQYDIDKITIKFESIGREVISIEILDIQ